MEAKVNIVNMDIVKLPQLCEVEAVVNSTNARAPGASGLDKSLHKIGGKALKRELDRVNIKERKTGEAFVTSAPGLKYAYIIHAIAPRWNPSETDELRDCYKSIFQTAIANGIRSVAFLAIGTGHLGVPVVESANIAVSVTKEFLSEDNCIDSIWFVLSEQHIADVYMRTMEHQGVEYGTLQKTLLQAIDENKDAIIDSGRMSEEEFDEIRTNLSNPELRNPRIDAEEIEREAGQGGFSWNKLADAWKVIKNGSDIFLLGKAIVENLKLPYGRRIGATLGVIAEILAK